ncbi:MAG: DNA polymerase II small subunit [Candidatus Micrarchaeota archaeon]|nr:MAG: DNA polymerase II small subunit [Candidatus Micrarchaeota archaeon]
MNEAATELLNRLRDIAPNIIIKKDATELISDVDIELLTAYIVKQYKDEKGLVVLDKNKLSSIIESIKSSKPERVEVLNKSYRAEASEIEAEYKIYNTKDSYCNATANDFVSYFRSRLFKIRDKILRNNLEIRNELVNINSIDNYASGRTFVTAGIIRDKRDTKNGNITITIEDETGSINAIIPMNRGNTELEKDARYLVNDEVIAVKGKLISKDLLLVSNIYFPDTSVKNKRSEDDIYIGFLSDIHVGSKLFLEKNFRAFLSWLNSKDENSISGKIKYLVISGDLVDGIGVYPEQERELSIADIYLQYRYLFDLLSDVPDYIHIFLAPGNHDAVALAEPQPPLPEDIIREFKNAADNISILPNPMYISVHKFNLVGYHGASIDSMIKSIPGLSYDKPAEVMLQLLRKRHLSPVYGMNPVIPSAEDNLVMEIDPDIFHTGHIHKNDFATHKGSILINSGTWQAKTIYQIKLGHNPTPCNFYAYGLKNNNLVSMDFSGEYR